MRLEWAEHWCLAVLDACSSTIYQLSLLSTGQHCGEGTGWHKLLWREIQGHITLVHVKFYYQTGSIVLKCPDISLREETLWMFEHCNICRHTCEYNCHPLWNDSAAELLVILAPIFLRGLTQFVWTSEWRSVISSKQTFPFNVLTINPNSDCQCAWVKMPSSLLTAGTAWRKLSLDIRGSQDKSGGLLACRHAEKKSDGPVKLSAASKVILIKDYYEKTWRYCQMSGLLWKYSPKMANRRQKGAQRSDWLADPPGGEGFISGAHNASVKGAPKVFLCIFVTED